MDRSLIETYAAGASKPAKWIEGLSPAELTAYPVPGTWSVHELVVHVLDSDLIATHRMRRIAAEPRPLLIAYDESLFVKHLNTTKLDLRVVCDLFALNRKFSAEFLRALPDEAFDRVGVHNQNGIVSLAQMVRTYIDHLSHHETFLMAKRRALGK